MTPPREVGGFVLDRKLGSGGMATVYLAIQRSLNRPVVVKLLHPHLAEDEALVARFEREARAAAQLKHENIVQVIDFGRSGAESFMAMELVEGKDLRQILDRAGPPPVGVAALLLRDVARGLEHAHGERIIHRDIKPANLMLTTGGTLKIMDFGLARLADDAAAGMTATGSILGTPAYMSPEQAEGRQVDERTDLFSLGVVGYELVGGCRPFGGDSYASVIRALLTHVPPPLVSLAPEVPPRLAVLIHSMLEKDPIRRPDGASVILSELETVVLELGLHRGQEILREFLAGLGGPARDVTVITGRKTGRAPGETGLREPAGLPNQETVLLGPRPEGPRIKESAAADREADLRAGPGSSTAAPEVRIPGAPRRSGLGRRLLWGAAGAVVLTTVLLLWSMRRPAGSPGVEVPSSPAPTAGEQRAAGDLAELPKIPGEQGSRQEPPSTTAGARGEEPAGEVRGGGAPAGEVSSGDRPIGGRGTAGDEQDRQGSRSRPSESRAIPTAGPAEERAARTEPPAEAGQVGDAVIKRYTISYDGGAAFIIIDGKECNPDGYNCVAELKPGRHEIHAWNPDVAPNIDRKFSYVVRESDRNNVLILRSSSGEVEAQRNEEHPF